jgi:hypothetical protein
MAKKDITTIPTKIFLCHPMKDVALPVVPDNFKALAGENFIGTKLIDCLTQRCIDTSMLSKKHLCAFKPVSPGHGETVGED